MTDGSRRFPPPWRADKMPGGYVIRDANGQAICAMWAIFAVAFWLHSAGDWDCDSERGASPVHSSRWSSS
jgi:hypothetical protein